MLDVGVTGWLRRFGVTVEVRNGWWRRNWKGRSGQRINRRRRGSSGGSLLPKDR